MFFHINVTAVLNERDVTVFQRIGVVVLLCSLVCGCDYLCGPLH